jgi:hypothetical protein
MIWSKKGKQFYIAALKRSSTTGKETSNIQTNMKYFELKAF